MKTTSSITDLVTGIRFVDGNSRWRNINDPEELRGFKQHLGLLGIITEVRLKTVEQFKLEVYHKEYSDDFLDKEDIPEMARKWEIFELWWFPIFKKIVVGTGKRVDISTKGEAVSNFIPAVKTWQSHIFKNAVELIQETRSYIGAENIEFFMMKRLLAQIPGIIPCF